MREPRDGELHPIGEVLAAVLQDGPDDVPIIDAEGLEFVQKALDDYLTQGRALLAAVDCVLTAAHLLEVEKHAEDAARDLVALVDRKEVIDALIAINKARDAERASAVARQADRFQQFTASESKRRAPGTEPADEEAPDGAVKLGNFHFPKRL
ncbi:MAG: hypothetical protein KC933_05945 [Myxococcales bacterium]|nr:hypothetical protein [Myxococcales bacterium]MCB9651040.1 hypothetical protein [Deltaproteobacteria bacterium]